MRQQLGVWSTGWWKNLKEKPRVKQNKGKKKKNMEAEGDLERNY
jgi:hypothetical protein